MDASPLHTATCVQGQLHDVPGSAGSCLRSSRVSVLEGEGQPGHGEGRRAGNTMYFPVSVRAVLAAGWSRDAREQRGHVCSPALHLLEPQKQFSHEEACVCSHTWLPLTRAERAQPCETIVMYVQLFEARSWCSYSKSGKGSEALGNQVELGRNSFVLLNTVYSWLV